MVKFLKSDDPQIVEDAAQVDLKKANYDEGLSSTELDLDSQLFHVSYDRVLFKTPAEIITTVLEANAYHVNLENVLACIDDLKFSLRVTGRSSGDAAMQVKSFMPCLSFHLPKKTRIGPSLQQFYREVEAYQKQIKENKKPGQKASPLAQQKDSWKEKYKDLENENRQLKGELAQIKTELGQMVRSEAKAYRALETQNLLPSDIRAAKVREVNEAERMIMLRAGRTNFQLPMAEASLIPEEGDKCLVFVDQGQVKGAFFYESEGRPLRASIAKVLYAEESWCKLRNHRRQSFNYEASHQVEREIFGSLNRGDEVLLYYLGEHLIRLEPLLQNGGNSIVHRVQEAMARYQLSQNEDGKGDSFARRPKA